MDRNFHKTALRMMSCFWIVALVISLLPHGCCQAGTRRHLHPERRADHLL